MKTFIFSNKGNDELPFYFLQVIFISSSFCSHIVVIFYCSFGCCLLPAQTQDLDGLTLDNDRGISFYCCMSMGHSLSIPHLQPPPPVRRFENVGCQQARRTHIMNGPLLNDDLPPSELSLPFNHVCQNQSINDLCARLCNINQLIRQQPAVLARKVLFQIDLSST